jgi:SAM-dependent methyltransferase
MTALHKKFLAHIPHGGAILDLGCGSGRDSLAFLQAGYSVTSLDGSRTMVDATTALTGQPARRLAFHELDYEQAFDGVWACASLLHVPRAELVGIWEAVLRSVRTGGAVYVSFKSGEGERTEGGRLFTDFTVDSLNEWLDTHSAAKAIEIWETEDARPGPARRRWVNAILRKPAE